MRINGEAFLKYFYLEELWLIKTRGHCTASSQKLANCVVVKVQRSEKRTGSNFVGSSPEHLIVLDAFRIVLAFSAY